MAMGRRKQQQERQVEFWIARTELPRGVAYPSTISCSSTGGTWLRRVCREAVLAVLCGADVAALALAVAVFPFAVDRVLRRAGQ
jgi:hypothetical protein